MSVYNRMTEWTSLSVTEEQKRKIEAAQEQAGHDGAIGRFIVQTVSDTNTQSQREKPVTLEATEYEQIAKATVEKLR